MQIQIRSQLNLIYALAKAEHISWFSRDRVNGEQEKYARIINKYFPVTISLSQWTHLNRSKVPECLYWHIYLQTKTLAGLFTKEKWFLALSLVNILAAVGLTLYRLIDVARSDPNNSDFTFTLLIIINAGIYF